MTPIISGTTVERLIRTLLFSVLVDVFAVLYFWDGYVGYQRQNAQEFAKLLGLPTDAAPPIHGELSSAAGRRLAAELKSGEELSKAAEHLGSPSVRQPDAAYYLGPGGWLKLSLRGDRVQEATWKKAGHTESDQQLQRWIGFVLLFVGVGATLQLARVLSTRATLSDSGLRIVGRPPIPFEAMTELRKPASGRVGIVELVYESNGRGGVVRLDDYVIKKLPAMVAAICERKGFSNPLSD
jgi:hypothetical protein